MDDGFGDFLGVATVLLIGGGLIPALVNTFAFGSPTLLPILVVLLVLWILFHVYSGLF